jgi:hypothetical protein
VRSLAKECACALGPFAFAQDDKLIARVANESSTRQLPRYGAKAPVLTHASRALLLDFLQPLHIMHAGNLSHPVHDFLKVF